MKILVHTVTGEHSQRRSLNLVDNCLSYRKLLPTKKEKFEKYSDFSQKNNFITTPFPRNTSASVRIQKLWNTFLRYC